MNHLFITLDDPVSLEAMNSYSGTELLGTRDGYAFWYCTNLTQEHIDKIHDNGVPQEAKLVGMILLNKPS